MFFYFLNTNNILKYIYLMISLCTFVHVATTALPPRVKVETAPKPTPK